MLNTCQKFLDEKQTCPHCEQELSLCNAPPFHVGDGLGWGTEFMFICLNDECPLYVKGWQHISEQYAHSASYRYMLLPGETTGTSMMVGSDQAFKGCVVDPESVKMQNERYCKEKEALGALDTCVEQNNLAPALYLVLDEKATLKGRERASALLAKLNNLDCVDPIRNHTFHNEGLENRVNLAISQILRAHFKKECPHCAEIIKAKARLCMHCKQELG